MIHMLVQGFPPWAQKRKCEPAWHLYDGKYIAGEGRERQKGSCPVERGSSVFG